MVDGTIEEGAFLNATVMAAILLTFPLQLQPAMQVLDQWLDQDIMATCQSSAQRRRQQQQGLPLATTEEQAEQEQEQFTPDTMATINHVENGMAMLPPPSPEVMMESPHHATSAASFQLMERNNSQDEQDKDMHINIRHVENEPDGLFRMDSAGSGSSRSSQSNSAIDPLDATWCCGIPQWLLRRWIVVLACAMIVLTTDNLSLLIGIFGAIGQTGLAAMPCAIHLALQHQGLVPKSGWKTCLHSAILVFCAAVMISSLAMYAR